MICTRNWVWTTPIWTMTRCCVPSPIIPPCWSVRLFWRTVRRLSAGRWKISKRYCEQTAVLQPQRLALLPVGRFLFECFSAFAGVCLIRLGGLSDGRAGFAAVCPGGCRAGVGRRRVGQTPFPGFPRTHQPRHRALPKPQGRQNHFYRRQE